MVQLAPDERSVLWLLVRSGPALYEARVRGYNPDVKTVEGGQITMGIRSILPEELHGYAKYNMTPENVGMAHGPVTTARAASMQLYALRSRAEAEYRRLRRLKGL
jgi:hypothetical protein